MERTVFSEYEDVLILVNLVLYSGNYDAVFECLGRRKSKASIKRRYVDFIRFFPYRVGNWIPYEDYMIGFWGSLELDVDRWDKLAFSLCRRAKDVRKRYFKITTSNRRLNYMPASLRSILHYQRGKRVVDVSYYVLLNQITPHIQTIKQFVNALKLFDDNLMDEYQRVSQMIQS